MKTLLTPAQMYALEQAHFDSGTRSIDAMEAAAEAFVRELEQFSGPLAGKHIAVACGSGNNGGDGYAIARLLCQADSSVTLIAAKPVPLLNGDALINAQRAIRELSIPCLPPEALAHLPRPDVWVDALFGIGLNRPLSELYQPLTDRIAQDRAAGSIVASVDVPSGLNAETGRVKGCAVHADLTVTFQHAKTGHYLNDGMDFTGRLVVRPLEPFGRILPDQSIQLITPDDPRVAFPRRPHNSHKGTYGHLLVVAGSFGMTGAAMYTAHAALRCGAGLVTIACPRSLVPILQTLLPAAMCIPLPEREGAISEDALPLLHEAFRGKNAVAVGPGLSTGTDPVIVRAVLESGLPAVVDADALNLISLHPALRSLLRPHHVLTPHPGEARRLCPECDGNPLHDAELLHALTSVILLKGAASVIRGERTYISASGSPGMATGGSGDVLTGIIAALLASGFDPETSAWAGSEIHGRCGELAERQLNPVSMTAADLIAHLPAAISEVYR